MNIILPIVSNLVIVLLITLGIVIGAKQEWKISLFKLFLTIAFIVGSYLLLPITSNVLSSIELLKSLSLSTLSLNTCIFSTQFSLMFIVSELILLLIARSRDKKRRKLMTNGIIIKRAKAIDKVAERELKKEDRRLNKLNKVAYKKAHKKARVFGSLISMLIYIVVSFIVFIPFKYIARDDTAIQVMYEYTIYRQIDSFTDNFDNLLK